MKSFVVPFTQDGHSARLRVMLWENSPGFHTDTLRPLIIICPGGAYANVSDDEQDVIAMRFSAMGYHTATLEYSCSKEGIGFPVALNQLAWAVQYVRSMAEKWLVNENKIIVAGFSAGGHLAASLGVYWNAPQVREAVGVPSEKMRPDGLILGYPVICADRFGHKGSIRRAMVGHEDSFIEVLSLENHVSPAVPPCFIWHTWEDKAVPVENSLIFASALRRAEVPFELHIYRHGPHGLSVADEQVNYKADMIQPAAQMWLPQVDIWLRELSEIKT